ncbi:cyclohexanone 1,2-monooxygenase [Aspergillus flavus AF70]|nr:cyclohexanone 1,2-monooxygenase [Aspergillus flavus AF70]
MSLPSYDALVVGAGFGGIYQLYSLLKLGLTVKLVERAEGPGGTWYWNRYPGATSDTPSHLYRYSWDKEDLQSYSWSHNYLERKEVLAYLEHVVERHDLRRHMQFHTEVVSAIWNDDSCTWTVESSQGSFMSRYLITSLGIITEPNWPNIPGRDQFQGSLYHTARWPDQYDLKGKSVGLIGNGSSGVQVITAIAQDVESLVCFQRHPQYIVPAGKRAVSQEERNTINKAYDEIWQKVKQEIGGMGVEEAKTSAMSVVDEERERIYQAAWDDGGAFRFLLGTFNDLILNEASNRTACDFLKKKIDQIVQDPEKRRKLTPSELYARRPVCADGYYEQFNRENVDVVDIAESPMLEFTRDGIKLADGTVHKLDVVICATGFNAFDGAYRRIDVVGREGKTLNEYWKDGPTTNMAVATAGFPNLFMIFGPQTPLTNGPPAIEAHVEFITGAISRAEKHRKEQSTLPTPARIVIESTEEGEAAWGGLCNAISDAALFRTAASYFNGVNVDGKPRSVYLFLGGLNMFLQKLKECEESEYPSFHPF